MVWGCQQCNVCDEQDVPEGWHQHKYTNTIPSGSGNTAGLQPTTTNIKSLSTIRPHPSSPCGLTPPFTNNPNPHHLPLPKPSSTPFPVLSLSQPQAIYLQNEYDSSKSRLSQACIEQMKIQYQQKDSLRSPVNSEQNHNREH